MAFGGKMHDGARAVLLQQARQQRGVADVALDKQMARIAVQCIEVAHIAGVGQLVQVQHRLAAARQPAQHEIGTNESGPASHENHLLVSLSRRSK